MAIEQYYTIEEVAALLKVTRQSIHNWIAEGRITSVKIGAARRIPASALERLLTESSAPGPKEERRPLVEATPA